MKFLGTQVTYFLSQNQTRQNIKALVKYLVFLAIVILVYTILFHFLMLNIEGREFSWITGLYWTLTVMSTLGFGDITFETDIGRIFSIIVMLSGTILLLIMLPFSFIRFFYAPWLEAQLHTQAPREVPEGTEGHILICRYDDIATDLIERLEHNEIEYFVIEPDSAKAAQLFQDGVSVVYGNHEAKKSYQRFRADKARLVFANAEDTANTNITLTVREIAPEVPIAAVASHEDSIDILELSGATYVLPLKHQLGEHLATRINIGHERTKIIGNFDEWRVFEFTVHNTDLGDKKLRDSKIRTLTGVKVIGVWEKGHLMPTNPDTTLSNFCVPVAVGTDDQVEKLERLLGTDETTSEAVLILGAGKVGRAAAHAAKSQGQRVFMVDNNKNMRDLIGDLPDRFVVGDAADRDTLLKAGLEESSLVILSTNDDAVNIYLSVYCRRLKPDVRIVCRITHERNFEAIHRAGADFVLGYAPLGAESVISLLQGRPPVIMGEGVEFFTVKTPNSLAGKTLKKSRIGSVTGMIVLAIRSDEVIANPSPNTVLPKNSTLNVLGTREQLENFKEVFE